MCIYNEVFEFNTLLVYYLWHFLITFDEKIESECNSNFKFLL